MRYGANQYRRAEGGALSPRETEAAAFAMVNRLLEAATDPDARMRALARNQQLWSLLLRDLGTESNRLPPVLKADLVRLGAWSLRTTIAAMGRPDADLSTMIRLNADLCEALRTPPAPVGHHTAIPAPGLALAG